MPIFEALADPTRRSILDMLGAGPRQSSDIAAQFAISAPAVSQHLKVLREARLVRVRAQAQRRIYALDVRGFDEVAAWLARYRSFWAARLDALEAALREGLPEALPGHAARDDESGG